MSIPLIYNIRSVKVRWASSAVAVLGIAGVVAVFLAMLSMSNGFRATMISSGEDDNIIIRRGGATSELESVLMLDQVKVISDASGVASSSYGPLVSPEVVVVAAFHHRKSGSDALAQVRGVSPMALEVRKNVRITEGRFFSEGLPELVVGRNALKMYSGFELGSRVSFGGTEWTVTGVMDSDGSAFDSEIWCDASILCQTYKRPVNVFSSVTAKIDSIESFSRIKDSLTSDPRLTVSVEKERNYYSKQSQAVSTLINVLGYMVAFVMGIGAVFGALNTMYSAISSRITELATLRALGFSGFQVMLSMIFESMFIALLGGITGVLIALPLNGYTASTINWQTFSQLAFAFRITPWLIFQGIVFALLMGFIGGLIPAIKAARLPVASALREK